MAGFRRIPDTEPDIRSIPKITKLNKCFDKIDPQKWYVKILKDIECKQWEYSSLKKISYSRPHSSCPASLCCPDARGRPRGSRRSPAPGATSQSSSVHTDPGPDPGALARVRRSWVRGPGHRRTVLPIACLSWWDYLKNQNLLKNLDKSLHLILRTFPNEFLFS